MYKLTLKLNLKLNKIKKKPNWNPQTFKESSSQSILNVPTPPAGLFLMNHDSLSKAACQCSSPTFPGCPHLKAAFPWVLLFCWGWREYQEEKETG